MDGMMRWLAMVSAMTLGGSACRSQPATTLGSAAPLPDSVDYNFDVRPIFSDKCFKCHGPDANQRQAGLRLDIGDSAFAPLRITRGAFALVRGDPGRSELYRRITSHDTATRMPPANSGLALSEREIAIIGRWIEQGAQYRPHWAFVPPVEPPLPAVRDTAWPKGPIDRLVLRRIEEAGLTPNPEADRERLLRRLAMDLTGLPPSIELMDGFLGDTTAGAYERMVDHLLAQPSYGEKMAIHWMDVARYADSHGYQDDNYRTMWPWRDWVIHAFNGNLPYNQFITWQLAGDLLPNRTREQLLATGFNRNHKITEEGGVIDEDFRVEYVADRTGTLGRGILGLTVECARCHDHKYDPISQREFYQLYAFFNNVPEKGLESIVGGPDTYAKRPLMEVTKEDLAGPLRFINKKDSLKLIVSVMGDRAADSARKTYILHRGNYDAPTVEVRPGAPRAILPFDTTRFAPNRLGLANWIFDPKNPLPARVFVNQMWEQIFGKGIVKTVADFGMQGELPSNPQLLDWLAVDFQKNGWDVKRLMKQIVMSATYRQSAVVSPEKLAADPENRLLSRFPRQRYPAELIRDIVLETSGLLVHAIGGPSVKPYQPPGLWEAATSGRGILTTYRQDHGEALYRRGLYTFIKRTVPPPSMMIFDASTRDQCEVRRLATNTPLQALVMMNDPQVLEAARVLAAKLLAMPNQPDDKLRHAFRLIVGRQPRPPEVEILVKGYADHQKTFSERPADAERILKYGEYPLPRGVDRRQLAAMMQLVSELYNLEETITKT